MNLNLKQTQKLIQGCLHNERKAQEELYKLFHSEMLRVCYTYLPDRELAKEAFNAGFLKVFQSIANFDLQKGELGGWIRKIMIHTAIDLARSELRFSTITSPVDEQDEEFIPAIVLAKLYFEDILVQVRQLPYATQTVFNLFVLDGFSHKEIGEQLNISEGTSRWHLAEAKKKLRLWLLSERNEVLRERRGDTK